MGKLGSLLEAAPQATGKPDDNAPVAKRPVTSTAFKPGPDPRRAKGGKMRLTPSWRKKLKSGLIPSLQMMLDFVSGKRDAPPAVCQRAGEYLTDRVLGKSVQPVDVAVERNADSGVPAIDYRRYTVEELIAFRALIEKGTAPPEAPELPEGAERAGETDAETVEGEIVEPTEAS